MGNYDFPVILLRRTEPITPAAIFLVFGDFCFFAFVFAEDWSYYTCGDVVWCSASFLQSFYVLTERFTPAAFFSVFGDLFDKKSLLATKSLYFFKKSSGICRNRSGTVSRVPGRSTCTYHNRYELRSPYDGRVMIKKVVIF